MEIYNSFEEKGKYFKFGGLKINTDEDFDHYTHLLAVQHSKGDFVFRGVGDSRYKLFNSAQRTWHSIKQGTDDLYSDELYDAFIIDLIIKCKEWNNRTIYNLLQTYGIKETNSVAYLGFMQHYGFPTPLMDFTRNPHKAFYFAIEKITEGSFDETDDMKNYFSIYYSYQNNTAFESFAHVFNKNRVVKKEGEIDYSDLTKNGIVLASERTEEFKILNNIRISNQEGLFFYNNCPYKPIEEQYQGFSKLAFEKFGREKCETELLIHDTFCGCLNFHKKYFKRVKEVIEKMGISKSFVYPEINDLGIEINEVIESYKKKE